MIEKENIETRKKIMYHDYFSNFTRRNCVFFSDAVPVHRVVRAVEFKMATGCKFLSLAASHLLSVISQYNSILFWMHSVEARSSLLQISEWHSRATSKKILFCCGTHGLWPKIKKKMYWNKIHLNKKFMNLQKK